MLIVPLNQVYVKCLKSLLCVSGSADLITAYVAHDMTKNPLAWELYNRF